ncbi:sulfurtransferase [Pseudarthrobacter sp. NPDC058196]|uniref:sulfurtransferase n=1 Tax=Pseudarthrobacter sp. NPDC058196 TaxID=3346376 RepID=UPI0036DBED1C
MAPTPTTPADLPPFVDTAWLEAHRNDVVIADARWYLGGASGRSAYDGGHVPGAVFVDLDAWLSGEAGPDGLNPLPDPDVFACGMSSLGIGDRTAVIAYDDAGGVIAARLVWMLRATGHPAALLDGGIAAWTGPLETTSVKPTPATFRPVPWPESRLARLEDITAGRAGIIVDARNADRFDGTLQLPTDPQAGHIPGAVNVPCRANLSPNGRLRPVAEFGLRSRGLGSITPPPSSPTAAQALRRATTSSPLNTPDLARVGSTQAAGRSMPPPQDARQSWADKLQSP